MTPRQIAIVEWAVARARAQLVDIAADFYERLFDAEPTVRVLFTSDPAEQRKKLADELDGIACMIRHHETFLEKASDLGGRHRAYGVQPSHYALAGPPLLGALAAGFGPEWTPEVEEAWRLAYNLTAEAMMAGASRCAPKAKAKAQS